MDQEPKIGSANKWNSDHMQEFLTERKIKPEDFYLIEKLMTFPKNLIIQNYHNFFLMLKERSGKELEGSIKNARNETNKEIDETFLEFYNRYDWIATHHLSRTLEKI